MRGFHNVRHCLCHRCPARKEIRTVPTVLVADQSSGSSQEKQRDSRSGRTGTSNAESSGKMQSETDTLSDSGSTALRTKFNGQSSREQGSGAAPSSRNSSTLGNSESLPSSGGSSMSGGKRVDRGPVEGIGHCF